LKYVTEEQRSRTGWIVCKMLVELLADGTSAARQKFDHQIFDCGSTILAGTTIGRAAQAAD
jgi:hypothetical protein